LAAIEKELEEAKAKTTGGRRRPARRWRRAKA
jgi:hypothetical protein